MTMQHETEAQTLAKVKDSVVKYKVVEVVGKGAKKLTCWNDAVIHGCCHFFTDDIAKAYATARAEIEAGKKVKYPKEIEGSPIMDNMLLEAGKPEKSLEECKCEISEKYGYKDQFHYEAFHDGNFPHDEAAELYASQFQAVIAEKEKRIKDFESMFNQLGIDLLKSQEESEQDIKNLLSDISIKRDNLEKANATIEAQKKEIERLEVKISDQATEELELNKEIEELKSKTPNSPLLDTAKQALEIKAPAYVSDEEIHSEFPLNHEDKDMKKYLLGARNGAKWMRSRSGGGQYKSVGYYFNGRIYQSLDELVGKTMSEGFVPREIFVKIETPPVNK